MIFRKLLIAAALAAAAGCSLPVTPPADWPPEPDTVPPLRPLDGAIRTEVTVDSVYRPAVRMTWLPVTDADVLMYRVNRYLLPAAQPELTYYRLRGSSFCSDTRVAFPADENTVNRYEYTLEAIDSAGNASVASDSHFVHLVAVPVLTAPAGGAVPAAPRFSWEVRFDSPKTYDIYLVSAAGDTVLDVATGFIYEKSAAFDYDELARNSSRSAPTALPSGTYRWWVRMVLADEAGKPVRRTGISAPGTFAVP